MLFEKINYLDEDFLVQRDAYIEIEDDRIKCISQTAPSDYQGERISGKNKLLMPGFANAHCHVPMTLLRGFGEGLPLQRWLTEKVFPFEDLLTDEDSYWGSLLGIAELLASGCVSFSDMYMNLPGIIKAVEESGIRANLSHGCSAPGRDPDFEATNAYQGTKALFEHLHECPDSKIRPELALHAEYTSNENTARTLLNFAKEHQLRVQIHVSETKKEHEEGKERRGKTPLRYLYDLGFFEVPLILAHCIWLEDSDFALLKEAREKGADITLVHNPSSNLKLASGFANLKRWEEAGVNIAIGTDGASSNNNLDMLEEINLASLVQKGITHDPSFMGPEKTFRYATQGGFRAQGISRSGLIKEGMKADLVVFDLDDYATVPQHDLAANALYAAGRQNIFLTMVDGKILYKEGQFFTLDIEKVKAEVIRIAAEKKALLNGEG